MKSGHWALGGMAIGTDDLLFAAGPHGVRALTKGLSVDVGYYAYDDYDGNWYSGTVRSEALQSAQVAGGGVAGEDLATELRNPAGIAVSSSTAGEGSSKVYIADSENYRVVVKEWAP